MFTEKDYYNELQKIYKYITHIPPQPNLNKNIDDIATCACCARPSQDGHTHNR